jgi:hypothetical protein
MSPERCAALAIAGIRARKREVFMTAQGRLGVKLKALAPGIVDMMAKRALAKAP